MVPKTSAGLLAAILLFLCLVLSAQAAPQRIVSISGKVASLSAEPASLTLVLRTFDGIHKLHLRQRAPFGSAENALDEPQAVLYQGRWINRNGKQGQNPAAALSLIGNRFSLVFHGKRRGRLYEFYGRLDTARANGVQSRFYMRPSKFPIKCANSGSQSLQSAAHSLAAVAGLPFSPIRYIEISTDADFDFYSAYGAETNATIQSILNTAEAIYIRQLGIRFDLKGQKSFRDSSQPYTSSAAESLLGQFRSYSEQNNRLPSSDVYHLFTAKDLDDSVIGLAYVGAACRSNEFSYGLTQKTAPTSIQALVTAHEIGHNLSATHDDPSSSLMSSIVLPQNTSFSDFSLGEIYSHIETYDPSKACLSDTSSSPLQLSARLTSSSGRSTFRATVSRYNITGCTLRVYGATRRGAVGAAAIDGGKARLLYEGLLEADSLRLRSRISSASSGRTGQLYFRAKIQCSGSEALLSRIRSIALRGSKAALSRQLNRLANRLTGA